LAPNKRHRILRAAPEFGFHRGSRRRPVRVVVVREFLLF
jgi:hypothetical protein